MLLRLIWQLMMEIEIITGWQTRPEFAESTF